MNSPVSDYKARARTIELTPDRALTIRAERGTEVRVLEGVVWITQEGHREDYIVPAGMRFCSGDRGSLVAGAIGHASRAVVSWTEPARAGGYARSGVWLDYGRIERLEASAHRLRAETLRRALAHAMARIGRAWRRLIAERRPLPRLSVPSSASRGSPRG
jgi:hypothetical protein